MHVRSVVPVPTSVDFAYLYPGGRAELFDIEVAAVRSAGLRLHAIRGCTPRLDGALGRDLAAVPGFDRIPLEETVVGILAMCEKAIVRHHDRSPHSRQI